MTEANKQRYNLIQQYLNGSLDPGRMHELEKEALEDPFLAEALDGYAEFEGSAQPHLSLLQRQLEARIAENAEKKNVFFFTWQRISVAAAASLLFISASILFWMKGINTENRIAGNAKNVEVTLTPNNRLGQEDESAEQYSQNDALTTQVEALTAFPQPQNETKVQRKVLRSQSDPRGKVTQNYAARTNPAAVISNSTPEKAADIISARPIVNESLIASTRIAPAESDMRMAPGYARSKDVTRRISTFSTSDSGSINRKALETVNSPASQPLIIAEETVQPINGWENYQAYIRQNKRLPAPAGDAGSVTIIFTIDSLGKPDTCRVEKGIDESYNAEAIRLLKEGPLWKVMKTDRKNVGYITVDFKN